MKRKSKFDFKRIGMKAVGVGGGAVAGEFANKLLANMNPMLRGGLKMAAGAILPEVIPMKDKTLVDSLGSGIIASGAIDIYNNLGRGAAASGIGDDLDQFVEEDYVTDITGIDDALFVSGYEENPISGNDDDDIIFD